MQVTSDLHLETKRKVGSAVKRMKRTKRTKRMKRWILALAFFLTLHGTPALAQESPALGDIHFHFGLSGMNVKHIPRYSDDLAFHLGGAGYKHVGRNWYLGAEFGTGGTASLLRSTSGITTYALNGKRVFAFSKTMRFDLGVGLSYNHVTYDEQTLFGSEDEVSLEDRVMGAQLLVNVQRAAGRFMLGVHFVYMVTADVDGVQEAEGLEEGWDYTNVRAGLHLGFLLH